VAAPRRAADGGRRRPRRADELADGLGNLVNRTIALVARNPPDGPPVPAPPVAEAASLEASCAELPAAIDAALAAFDLRAAAAALWEVVAGANRFVSATRPWELARAARLGDGEAAARLHAVLDVLLRACETVASELSPFLPQAAERVHGALSALDVEQGRALFAKVEAPA
jgi:methionyl-tRNA synthetase